MATDNSNIEKLLDEMKKKQSNELAAQLTEALGKAFVYVPATMPKDTDPAILKKMMENPGVESPIPEEHSHSLVFSRMTMAQSSFRYLHQRRRWRKERVYLSSLSH